MQLPLVKTDAPASPRRQEQQARSERRSSATVSFRQIVFLICVLKLIFLLLDPNPQLFLGDSASYLQTAMTKWIPLDRSYVYGFLIRWLTLESGSLFSLVLGQALVSTGTVILFAWLLVRFFRLDLRVTMLAAIFLCIEPLQLMYERFVMAEASSFAASMAYVWCLLLYLESGRYRFLVTAALAGVLAVALRISYLPVITVLSFSAPFIRAFVVPSDRGAVDRQSKLQPLLIGLVVVTITHFTFQTSYKVLTGVLTNRPAAYQYADGFSLLSSWAPLLQPVDLKAADLDSDVFVDTYGNTLEGRRAQRWMPRGMVTTLSEHYAGDAERANTAAKRVAVHILKRDPLGVAGLAVRTYLRAWPRPIIKRCISEDTGDRALEKPLVQVLAERFHIAAADMQFQKTITKRWFRKGVQWYRVLLITPFLLFLTAPFCPQSQRPFFCVVAIYSFVVLLTAVGLAVDNSIRYLHPLGWAFVVFVAVWADRLIRSTRFSVFRTARTAAYLLFGCCLLSLANDAKAAGTAQGLYVSDGVLMRAGKPYLGIGANYNTLFGTLLQNKDDTSSLDNLSRLAKAGIPFVRFRACGFGPENYRLYMDDRAEYFRRMDQVVACAERNHIGLIPSLFWRLATVSELLGEGRSQLGNSGSRASQFVVQYTREMVERYHNSPAIWAWEFGNEANLGVDLGASRVRRDQPFDDLTSAQLRSTYSLFARTVRSIDSSRVIEPGTGLSRPGAWHLAHGETGRDDSDQAFSFLLGLAPDPMGMVSVHVYEKAKEMYPGARGIADVLSTLTRNAAASHKPLFVGEFPVRDRGQTEEFLQAIEAARVPLSAFWVFDYAQQDRTMSVSFNNERAFVLDLVAKANGDLRK